MSSSIPAKRPRRDVDAEGLPAGKRARKNDVAYRLANQPDRASSSAAGPDVANASGTPRPYTVSIAVPGSIIDNCQSLELKTYVAGQIARAAALYLVDEVVVYNDTPSNAMKPDALKDPCVFLAKLLQYQECPQYLRKEFFPVHPSLRFAGLLNPLDAPHHVRADTNSLYRDGVVLEKRASGAAGASGCLVHCGLQKPVYVPGHKIKKGLRVTLRMHLGETGPNGMLVGTPVGRSEPRSAHGVYWGYTVRLAEGLSGAMARPGGNATTSAESGSEVASERYDVTVGVAETGIPLADALAQLRPPHGDDDDEEEEAKKSLVPPFGSALVVFGGVKGGLESAVDADEEIQVSAEDAQSLFDVYVNTVAGRGSRTIRTEEQVLVSLAVLHPHLLASGKE
ncbi:putative RNA methyltransferase [Blastocladiella britannica]|nr:putative RNA methyltransferase [Blastocladiella britannica]